jgi:hypothetical protein
VKNFQNSELARVCGVKAFLEGNPQKHRPLPGVVCVYCRGPLFKLRQADIFCNTYKDYMEMYSEELNIVEANFGSWSPCQNAEEIDRSCVEGCVCTMGHLIFGFTSRPTVPEGSTLRGEQVPDSGAGLQVTRSGAVKFLCEHRAKEQSKEEDLDEDFDIEKSDIQDMREGQQFVAGLDFDQVVKVDQRLLRCCDLNVDFLQSKDTSFPWVPTPVASLVRLARPEYDNLIAEKMRDGIMTGEADPKVLLEEERERRERERISAQIRWEEKERARRLRDALEDAGLPLWNYPHKESVRQYELVRQHAHSFSSSQRECLAGMMGLVSSRTK